MSAMRSPVLVLLLIAVGLSAAGCGSAAVSTNTPGLGTPMTTSAAANPAVTPSPQAAVAAPAEMATGAAAAGTPSPDETAMQYIRRVDTTLAKVNGQEITWEYYEPSLRQAVRIVSRQGNVNWNDPAMRQRLGQLQNDVLTQTVDRWLLRKIAADQGVAVSPEQVQAKIDGEKAGILASDLYESWEAYLEANGYTEQSFEQVIYDTLMLLMLLNAQQVETQELQVRIAHISVDESATAQAVAARLKAGESFNDLAAQYSTDEQTKDMGGDLGWFSLDLMLPELSGVAATLEPGQFSDVIQTRYGFTVLIVLEREVRDADPAVLARRQQAALMAVLQGERERAEIEILVDFNKAEGEPE